MRTRVACLVLVGLFLLGGCSGSEDLRNVSQTPSPSDTQAPTLGGERPAPATPPSAPMDTLEQPIAAQLSERVAGWGLTLDYLDCPKWDNLVPGHLTCVGYFDGVTARVLVRFHAEDGSAVSFDAVLERRVIATNNLVDRLTRAGYSGVDCGDVPAYPTRVGGRLVCAVTKGDKAGYIVVTVTDRTGHVVIKDY